MLKRIALGAGAIVGALLLLAALGWQPAEMATQTAVSYTALPGGKLDKIRPGDYLSVGYIYKVTDTTYPVDVGILNPKVVLGLRCNQSGWGVTLEVKMPDYRDTSINDKTNPDILQGSPDVDAQVWGYQGMVQVPDLCGSNGSMTLDTNTGQATFSAEVQSNKAARVRMKFHLRDPQAKGYGWWVNCSDPIINPPKKPLGSQCSGSWTSEFSAYPSRFWTPTPTVTATATIPAPVIPNPVTVSGQVFNDLNGDGKQCPLNGPIIDCEPGVAGVTVRAIKDQVVVLTATTDASGNFALPLGFQVPPLPQGLYTIHVDVPPGYVLTTQNNDVQVPVTLWARTVSFGIQPPATPTPTPTIPPVLPMGASISGQVFNDLDGSGYYVYPDVGVPGVTVQAFDVNGTLVRDSVSDVNGTYTLGMIGMPEGQYRVHVVTESIPPAYVMTTANDQWRTVTRRINFVGLDIALRAVATPTPTP